MNHQERHDDGQNHDLRHGVPGDPPAPVQIACSVVLSNERHRRLTEGIQHEILENLQIVPRRGTGHNVCPQTVDRRLHDRVGDGKHNALHPRRHPDLQDPSHDRPVDPKAADVHVNPGFVPHQQHQKRHGAENIGDHRGDGDTVHAAVKSHDKDQVQRHVHRTGQNQNDERGSGVSPAPENGCLEIIQHDERHAGEIDPEIDRRQRRHRTRNRHELQNRANENEADASGDHAAQHRNNDGCVHRLGDPLPVIPADTLGNDRIGADGQTHKKIDQQADDRPVTAHGRHGVFPHEAADDGDIRRIEQLLQHGPRRQREGKHQKLVPQRPVEHIQIPALPVILGFQILLVHSLRFPRFIPLENRKSGAAASA